MPNGLPKSPSSSDSSLRLRRSRQSILSSRLAFRRGRSRFAIGAEQSIPYGFDNGEIRADVAVTFEVMLLPSTEESEAHQPCSLKMIVLVQIDLNTEVGREGNGEHETDIARQEDGRCDSDGHNRYSVIRG